LYKNTLILYILVLKLAVYKFKRGINTMKNKSAIKIEPYIFIIPTIVIFLLVLLIPMINLFIFSLGDSNIIQGYTRWNNFENFKYLLDPKFFRTLLVTILWLIGSVIGMMIFGMLVSLALNKPIKGRGFFRAMIIIPWIIPHAFAASMWGWVLNPQFGLLNQLLVQLNIVDSPVSFLSEKTALITVTMIRIWQGTPFIIMSLLAALQTIPVDVEEAALMDGTNGFQKFWYITLPHLKPILKSTGLIISAWTLQIFDTVYVLTGGGPAKATQIIAIEIYQKAFLESDLGAAAAIAIFTIIIIAVISLSQLQSVEGDFK
jgi:multiple sugar transport system permease protein